ncbi:MAG: OadG family protein [Lachnospiraceae bacterium]|nr:OadG family protein [Lachnospiraceae bacterium]
MKKLNLILCLTACIFCLTACGGEAPKTLDPQVASTLEQKTSDLVTQFLVALDEQATADLVSQGPEALEYVVANYFGTNADGNAVLSAVKSWDSAKADMGDFVSITEMDAEYDDSGRNINVTLKVVGSKKEAYVEAIYKDDLYKTLTSLTTNIDWTFGEKMQKAGLNTLLGMGTVFIVLIIISIIISLFNFIPKIQAAFNKDKQAAAEKEAAVDNTIMQIIEKEEQEEDDLELVAVITAAVAAASGSSGSDGFVVRSIKRRNNSVWNM